MPRRSTIISAIVLAAAVHATPAQAPARTGKSIGSYRSAGGTTLKLFLDSTNVGRDVSLGEITFPPNADSGNHQHGAIEIFYVISGELEHVVNGKSQRLTPGMVGYVSPPDTIRHRTGPAGATAVVVWVPGAEAHRIVSRWAKEP
jgi:quercetin dioxygenase-like cupin family protein